MRVGTLIDLLIVTRWLPQVYIGVVQVKFRFYITQYCSICFDDFPESHFDEKIERVNMLLDQAFDFEERW